MRNGVVVVVLAALVLLSGCTLSLGNGSPSVSPGGGGEPVWTGDEDNPFRQETLVVAVDGSAADGDVTPLVREALSYWEANSEQYAGYPIDYRLAANASDPDLQVRFVDSVDQCGTEEHAAGCAPVITKPGQFDPPVEVRIKTGFSDASTVQVLKHELGHTLGLDHGDEPAEVMAASSTLTTPPRTNASDRALPWDTSTLSVYVDMSAVAEGDREEARRQVAGALGYFADGANGTVPENVSFVRTDNRTAADITIRAVDDSPCSASSGSCGYLRGTDPDGDGAHETYTRLEITVTDLDTKAIGWHVGRWLGSGFGLSGEEYPQPLRESASYQDRRSDWWT
jgi:hypothetical protein